MERDRRVDPAQEGGLRRHADRLGHRGPDADLHGIERGKYLYGNWQERGRANFCLATFPLTFDREILRLMAAGNAHGMARFFDNYTVPAGDRSQDIATRGRGATGMPSPGGPQGGTRETCNWIAAAAVADGKPATIVDYVPVYASPIGAGFAYWAEV